ncbi:MAG: hypothetical protein EBX76_03575 [Acidimicrobiia bacterium]|nr:hypothetical protein [Acidimicrobiia bacterium]
MLQPLNIAVDSLVASAVPDLTTHADAEDLRLGVFSAFESPTAIAERLKAFKPDIILVDSVWLVLAALLESLTKVSGLTKTRRVVGSKAHYSVQSVKNRLGIMMKRSGVANRTQLAWQFTNQLLIARMVEQMEHVRVRDDMPNT